ncbi:hypothetical protein K488DRAFT_50605 [Vararia minispora EC-137]|uniref:Uncharacterized protein n=1 Tax=Vararia minispora EC-137 TaxID=1314806 RepID=A0ACB8QKG3_9AGAM|nr:hypothetical protein K488DRAFT_50605 [Vararia minispora EC-137]
MNKTQFYLSQCADAASKSAMCFTLGAVLVKGGKIISSGYNHHRPHYDGADVRTRGHRKPVSMHAEMHAIFTLTGMSPSFRNQQSARAPPDQPQRQTQHGDGDTCRRSRDGKGRGPLETKAWAARRRDPRVNGADIYVARVTKAGMGSARPCWRCVEWCRWAGVKRIFHWNADEGRFDVVKVNSADPGQYETHADIRLFAGMVSSSRITPVRGETEI